MRIDSYRSIWEEPWFEEAVFKNRPAWVVAEMLPDCLYSQCVLRAGLDARRIVRQALSNNGEEACKKRLTRRIRTLFGSKNLKQVKINS